MTMIDKDNVFFFFSSRRRHTRYWRDWSSDVCSSDLANLAPALIPVQASFKILGSTFFNCLKAVIAICFIIGKVFLAPALNLAYSWFGFTFLILFSASFSIISIGERF